MFRKLIFAYWSTHQVSKLVHCRGEPVFVRILVVLLHVLHVGQPDLVPNELFFRRVLLAVLRLPRLPLRAKRRGEHVHQEGREYKKLHLQVAWE